MEMEASTSPSSSPTDLSTGKKMGGRKTTRHPLYRGVRRRSSGKWVSEVREPSKRSRIWLGTFPNPEMAAVAHDAAVVALQGHGAVQVQLNFPGSAHRLPRVACTSPAVADIQRVALQAARDFINAPASSSTLFSHNNNNNNNKEEEGGGGEVEFVDEEAMFNMPLLVDCMAEGMLLTPPAMKKGFNWTQMEEEDLDDDVELDFSIWGWGWGD